MSQQIIEVLDYLFEKFGIAIDWTAENVMPYVQELAGKIVTYNIVTEAIWIACSVIALIGCCIYAGVLYKSNKKCRLTKSDTLLFDVYTTYSGELKRNEMSGLGVTLCIFSGVVVFFAILTLCFCTAELLRWIFIPELQLVDYISHLVNTVQM